MVAVHITGMSGAGKSTALRHLAGLGFETVDTDDQGWIEVIDGERLWRLSAVRRLLESPRTVPLFVSGTVANQGALAPAFDAVVLLTAPRDVLLRRIEQRTSNPYGKAAEERAAVLRDIAETEPRLRAATTHVLDTTATIEEVVARLVAIAGSDPRAPAD